MDFANNRLSYNGGDMRGPNGLNGSMSHGLNGYGAQHNQNGGNVSGNANHYNNYDHAVSQPEMANLPVKSEETDSPSFGRSTRPNDGMPNTQESAYRWNGSLNTNGAGALNGNGSLNGNGALNGTSGDSHENYSSMMNPVVGIST
jgi:hypothetical protein